MIKPWEEAKKDIDLVELTISLIDILVFKGHISKDEGDKLITRAINFASKK